MANIIPSGTTETASSDFTLTAGTPATVSISAAGGAIGSDAKASIQQKSAGGVYQNVAELNWKNVSLTLFGAGTFRVQRHVAANAFAVDKD